MTPEQTIAKLQAAQGDPQKLALITLEIVLSGHQPELRNAFIAAAIPHWFDTQSLAKLLQIDETQAAGYIDQLQRLPMVERFATRDAWNIHEATRLALRSQLVAEQNAKFRELSARAAQCFLADESHQRVEHLFHLLVSAPAEAESDLSALRTAWRERQEQLALGPLLLELEGDRLLPQTPQFQLDLARLYQSLGDLARIFGQSQTAHVYFLRQQAICEQLLQSEPGKIEYEWQLSISFNRLGDLARDLGQNEQAQAYFQKDLAISERLAQAEPNRADLQRDLSVSYGRLGVLARDLGQNEQAQTYFQKALAISERLAQAEPNRANLQHDLSVSYHQQLGDLALTLGQNEPAQAYFQKALVMSERLAQAEPNRADLQRDLSVSYHQLGDLALTLGQNEPAQAYFQKALVISERLAQAEPNRADLQRDLSFSYHQLGILAHHLGQNEQAQAYFQKDLAIAERLALAEPNRADLQRDLFISYSQLNDFPRALAILEILKKEGRILPTDEPYLDELRNLVQKSKASSA
jgi:tetratricopeptide (TPR) repeat protein